ncbi:imidazole glycerol phosphate synthase subunit HisH [Thalassotalea aquiviva]|uniref:imidazole glycerol phosphate synthase subunit HisH n=1 Tax=Thalassotalea aquiviva TaxID=3242415 RepID=UPI00352A7503
MSHLTKKQQQTRTTGAQHHVDAVIIDTGCANISSLKFALERLGYRISVSKQYEHICHAAKVFLPGVGSAAFAMQQVEQRQLTQVIQSLTQPVLGICLGMQLMTKHSIENDTDTSCLGLIDTNISRINVTDTALRLPHMGWNTLTKISDSPLFEQISEQDYFYFVHSYCAPITPFTLAQCQYGQNFSASLQANNFYGVQFHPERSGQAGATLLRNFMELCQ